MRKNYIFFILFFVSIVSNAQDIVEHLQKDICLCVEEQIKNYHKRPGSVLGECLSKKIKNYLPEYKKILLEENFATENQRTYGSNYVINVDNLDAFIAGHQEYFVDKCESYYTYVNALRIKRLIDIKYRHHIDYLNKLTKKIKKGRHKNEDLYERALIYMSKGQYDKAKADFYKYQEEDPNDDRVTYHLGWACELNGEYGVALGWYKHLIKKNNHFEAILALELTNRKMREKKLLDAFLLNNEYSTLHKRKESIDRTTVSIKNKVEIPPVAKGCEKMESVKDSKECLSNLVKKLVAKNFNYNILDLANLKPGLHNINTKFKISKEGKVTNIHVLHENPFIVNEITRLLLSIPIVKPGTLDGKPVGVLYTLPLWFTLSE